MKGEEMEQIDAFLAVLASGSYTAAGRQLQRDASVISRRVTALEQRLGVQLLARSTRRVSATEAGLRYRDKLRTGLTLLQEADDEVRSLAVTPRGRLRLALPVAFGRRWLAPMLPEFMQRYPEIVLETCYADRYVDVIAERFDAALRIGVLQDSRLLSRRLAPTRRMICASPAWRDRHPALRKPADLRFHDCLGFAPMASHPYWHLESAGESEKVRVECRLVTDDAESLIPAALAGLGVMIAADWLVAAELANGSLVRVLPEWQALGEDGVFLVHPSSSFKTAALQVFADWLQQALANRW